MTDLQTIETGMGDNPCLLVVDASLGFTDPSSPLGSEFSSQIDAIAKLMKHAHEKSWPCYLTTVVYRSDDEARVFREKLPALEILTPDSKWVAIDPRLPDSEANTVVEKTHASAFFGTGLGPCLKKTGIDTVIVTGFTTSGCVRASAVDALQWDFRVAVVKEAVGDRNMQAHEANLYDLKAKYADLVSTDEVLRQQ